MRPVFVIDDFADTQCGFKLFRGSIARELFREARIDRFAYDVEILALAKKYNHAIREVRSGGSIPRTRR